MNKNLLIFALYISIASVLAHAEKRIISKIDTSKKPELVLIQSFRINSPIKNVWEAYSTKDGWEAWAVPMAEIDFKIGGLIRTNYNKQGTIGDKTTIVIHIINYVPEKLITLQAELTEHFPEFMQQDAKNFYNVIYFTAIDKQQTKIESYGIGYKDTEKYKSLLDFFISANEKTYINLINYLEKGIKAEYQEYE